MKNSSSDGSGQFREYVDIKAPVMQIAIVGMGCRLAGAATSPEGLWRMLSKGHSGWSRDAGNRFKLESFYHPATEIGGAFNAKGMYVLKQDISHFDNQFFNISPVEAKAIDPQQRLMLEVAYEAFENAGMPIESISSSNTGVYCAVSNHDYETMQSRDPEMSPSYRFTGTGGALVANRISYSFNLKGPSVTIDTACSGSLVAIHEACEAIRTGQVKQALVGGTNLILDPERVAVMSSLQVLSDHGRCYMFDSRADGFGRGEGVAAVVLKPLSDALQDGDPIQGVIVASTVNQDGKTPGITMPSQDSQAKMIRKVYSDAMLDPSETTYVEAHGTGTQVGDKIESAAIAEVFCVDRSANNPLYVGSVKTNIGHTESTAGLAGLLKTVLLLKKGKIPPNLNFAVANDKIPLDLWNIMVPTSLVPWPKNAHRRASVNSFGYGGTNAHLILESPDAHVRTHAQGFNGVSKGRPERRQLFALTHDNERGISTLAANLKQYLQQTPEDDGRFFSDLAYTLSARRSRLAFRVAVAANGIDELLDELEAVKTGKLRAQRALEAPKICFAFTGQGAQWAGMGMELIDSYPVFAESMKKADTFLGSIGAGWSLINELKKSPKESEINEAFLSQPCCTAVQVALVDLLRSWNIHPKVVCGHSSGEIAAAYSAGLISAEDAMSISFHRGQVVDSMKVLHPVLDGGMLAVGLSETKAKEYISNLVSVPADGKVVIACINSPESVTLSGDKPALKLVQHQLNRDGVFNRALLVDIAYHSHHMILSRQRYLEALKGIKTCQNVSGVRMVSSVTGKEIQSHKLDAGYWAENMTSTVRFSEALEGAALLSSDSKRSAQAEIDMIVEIGPHSALAGPIRQILKRSRYNLSDVSYQSVLLRNVNAVESAIDAASRLFSHGVYINFDEINNRDHVGQQRTIDDLPGYNWQHNVSHWNEGRVSFQYRHRKFPRHELLGIPSHDSLTIEPTWRSYLRRSELPWLEGHNINGQVVFPASGHLSMAIEALRQVHHSTGHLWKDVVCRFRQVIIERALIIPDDATGVEVLFTLRRYVSSAVDVSPNWKEFRVFSVSDQGEALEQCRGLVSVENVGSTNEVEEFREQKYTEDNSRERFEDARVQCSTSIDPRKFYSSLKAIGMAYTGPFESINRISLRSLQSTCQFSVPDTTSSMPGGFQQPHAIHPATLDTCFQTALASLMGEGKILSSFVLSSIDEIDISSEVSSIPGTKLETCTKITKFGHTKYLAEILVGNSDLTKPALIAVRNLSLTSTNSESQENEHVNVGKLCHRVNWGLDFALAKPDHLKVLCRDGLPDVSSRDRKDSYDLFCQSVIQDVLPLITPEDIACMPIHHRKLVNWMRARRPQPPVKIEPDLRKKVVSLGVEGEMLVQVSDHLVEILKGKVEPLSVLMKDDLLFRVYSTDNTDRCHLQLAHYVRQLQHKNPQMKILELGAGTASTSIRMLESLIPSDNQSVESPKIDKYVFTDISSGFFEKAKAKLEPWAHVLEFKKLDVEKAVNEQGFEEGTYDLVIAANVIHATESLSKTLANVRKLLKSGGKLALVEITQQHLLWPLVVGSLPGWWLGEPDGRVESPLLDAPRWNTVMLGTQFSGVDIELKDYESVHEHQVSVLISTALSSVTADDDEAATPLQIVSQRDAANISQTLVSLFRAEDPQRYIEQRYLSEIDASQRFCVVLVEAITPFLLSCSEREFASVKKLLLSAKGVLWVTKGGAVECQDPKMAVITGLARTIRSEHEDLKVVVLDLDPHESSPINIAHQIREVFNESFGPGSKNQKLPEFEYAVRNGTILIPRIVENESVERYVQCGLQKQDPQLDYLDQSDRALGLKIATPGLLETLYWTDNPIHAGKPGPNEVRIKVGMMALNFKDLFSALGQLDGLSAMLIECTGIVIDAGEAASHNFSVGDRVCAINVDGLATTSNIDQRLVQRIPDGLSPEVAAAVQISYVTALYALRDIGRLSKGETVLIHSGSGALGQAAIAIAQYLGAGDIFVTVSSQKKKELVMQTFGIPEEHIFSSRGLTFGEGIRRQTNGRGVDIVLNSLSGDAARVSQNCLAPFGRFLEAGMKDLLSNTKMDMKYLLRGASFATVDVMSLAMYKPSATQELLRTVIALIHTKQVQVLQPITVSSMSEIEEGFRSMQVAKHLGKIVLRIDSKSQVPIQPASPPLPQLRNDASYLVVGGLGGLGRAVVKHLVNLGAKHIVTLSRSSTESSLALVEELRQAGVTLTIYSGSVVDKRDLEKIKRSVGGRPIRGVVQGAMVLQDSIFGNMTHEKWQTTLAPKITGTLNLESVFGDGLDFFILLSSGCGIVGSHGQGNYSAASTFQDAFARRRASLYAPVCTIDLGIVSDVGYTAENEAAANHASKFGGVKRISLSAVLGLVNHAIAFPTSFEAAQILVGLDRADPNSGSEEAAAQRADPRFSHVWTTGSQRSKQNTGSGEIDLRAVLQAETVQSKAIESVRGAIVSKLSRLLATPVEDISPDLSVSSYGTDSLTAVELRNWVAKTLEAQVQIFELMSPMSIQNLAKLIAERSRLLPASLFSAKD